ncbi:MAG: formate/nitrite transporter, partial [Frankiales bacterium]|nr:formate/nitrite transporter [Frankiales bacterium]
MPRSVAEAVDDTAQSAVAKAGACLRPWRFTASSALAGAYVGVAVVLLLSVSAPFAAAGSPATRLVQAAVFGVALTLVVFAGGELFTGNVMAMAHGRLARRVGARHVAVVCLLSLLGNAVGSGALAWAVHAGGTLGPGTPGRALLSSVVAAKQAATGTQLFWRAVLCNALVCLAVWMATRAATDGAKLMVLWWGLLAFVGSGFEHSVANMTTFSLAALSGVAPWSALPENLAWTLPGNVAGGLLVALAGRVQAAAPVAGAGPRWLALPVAEQEQPVLAPVTVA